MSNNQANPTTPFTFYQAQSPHEAMGLCAMLAQFDSRKSSEPFQHVMNEIHACVMHRKYAIIAMSTDQKRGTKDTPVGYILWGHMNFMSSAIYGKGTRQLSPSEYNNGEQLWIVHLCTPFGMKDEIFKYCNENIQVLAESSSKFCIDLFEAMPHSILNAQQAGES